MATQFPSIQQLDQDQPARVDLARAYSSQKTPTNQLITRFQPRHDQAIISCHNCGNPMKSNGQSTCNECICMNADITRDLPKTGTLTFCRNCGRVKVPPKQWTYAQRESRELMAICLKRLRALSHNTRFVDARFIWTEPHSRRTKLRITVQGEAADFNDLTIQQSYDCEFYEETEQCPDCAKSYTANTWRAGIQVRQKVEHKKTFLYLEQLILKSKAHKHTMSISESREGIDFYYATRNDAIKMVEFLTSVAPVKVKTSGEIISENIQNATRSSKFTYSVELAPICREDLVVLPLKIARAHANISQLLICYRINQNIHLIDPLTLQATLITSQEYWKSPFSSVSSGKGMIEFMVLDIELTGQTREKYALAEATVARSSDLGSNDTTYFVRTHLGGLLHAGDLVMGYDLTCVNYNHAEWDTLKQDQIPEIVLVKKVYPAKPRTDKRKFRRMAVEYNNSEEAPGNKRRLPGQTKDFEEFLEELENDPELQEELYISDTDEELVFAVGDLNLDTNSD